MKENSLLYKTLFGVSIGIISLLIAASLASLAEFHFLMLHAISITLAILIVTIFFSIINLLIKSTNEIIENSKSFNHSKNGKISRNRFVRLAIDAVKNPILMLDDQKHLLIANKAARARFSIPKSGIRLEQFLRSPEILNLVDEAIISKSQKEFSWENFFPKISYEKVEISTFVVDGALRIILIISDESNMRKAEQMRVDFLANAGHELRTPLASIRGFLETIEHSAKDDKEAIARFIPIMSREAERMSRLINDILSLSKIELNEHIAPINNIDIIELVNNDIALSEPSSKKRNIKIKLLSDKKEALVIGDKDEIQQVILNLIDNAIKYGNENSEINIFETAPLGLKQAQDFTLKKWENSNSLTLLNPIESDAQFLALRFENFGKAIAPHFLPRLSERFYRVDDESAHIRGTGLGLAIVKHIVKRHNGGLYVETITNDKIAFSIIIPVIEGNK